MARLTLSASTGAFSWIGSPLEREAAEAAGLTRSATPRPDGSLVYFTADYSGKPEANPYAALPFWDIATDAARAALADLRKEEEASRALASDLDVPVPDGCELLPFQRAGIAYAVRRRHSLIGDDMGLGKTVQALGLANLIRAKRILVLCPAAVTLQWRRMAAVWLLGKPVIHVMKGGRSGVHPTARVVICSYDTAKVPAVAAALGGQRWDLAVLDEAHYLKNHDARRTRAILGGYEGGASPGVLADAERIVALTGTPLPNRPRECYTLARALCWDAIDFMSEEAFQFRYNPAAALGNGAVIEQTGRLPELQARLRVNFMVRRLKSEAAPQLPAKRYELVEVDSAGTRKVVAREKLLDIPDNVWQNPDALFDGHIAALRREMGLAKVPIAADYIKTLLSGGNKVFVVAHHLDVLKGLQELLADYNPVGVTGATSPTQRMARVQQFQRDPSCQVFLGQIKAIGTGVDGLQQVCDRAVFVEASWTPGENEQAGDRLHRHGQANPVQIDFLVAPGSLDERVLSRVVEKLRNAHSALDARKVA